MLPNGDYFEGCFINGGVCGEGKFTSKASGVSFSGKFGRRRNPQHDAPNTFELEDTMIYRGLSTAKGLMPLKLFEESKTLEAPSAAPSAGAAAAVEAAPSADSDDDLAAVRGSLKPRPPRKKKAKREGEDEEHQQPVYAHSMILTGTHHTQQASKQASGTRASLLPTPLLMTPPLSLHTTISLYRKRHYQISEWPYLDGQVRKRPPVTKGTLFIPVKRHVDDDRTSSRMDRCGPQHSSSSVQSTCTHTHSLFSHTSIVPPLCVCCCPLLSGDAR